MTSRLNLWCDENKKISEYQAAYKKGTGCEDHIFTLNAILQNHLKNKKNVIYALFIDLTKAFDSIKHDKVWEKLYKIGLSKQFISMVQTIYRNARAKVRIVLEKATTSQYKKVFFKGNVCQRSFLPCSWMT
jgi:ABC-type uncharacterized transport system YnjBCD ATPase subunit